MEQTFRDMLKDNNAPALWFRVIRVIRVIKELPYSLLQEYLDIIRERGGIGIERRNYNLGLATLIIVYLTVFS